MLCQFGGAHLVRHTKRTQHGVNKLHLLGLLPSNIFCCSCGALELLDLAWQKISNFVKSQLFLTTSSDVSMITRGMSMRFSTLVLRDQKQPTFTCGRLVKILKMTKRNLGEWGCCAQCQRGPVVGKQGPVCLFFDSKYTTGGLLQHLFLSSMTKAFLQVAVACQHNLNLQRGVKATRGMGQGQKGLRRDHHCAGWGC
jgi:hypothetical protein